MKAPFRSAFRAARAAALAMLAQLLAAGVHAEAPRIVSLAPHLTELAYQAGIGERLVGAVEWSDYPEAALKLPRIGDAFRFDSERLLTLEATHALAWVGGTPEAAVAQIASLGIEVVSIETTNLDQIGEALVTLGRLGGRPEAGRKAAVQYRAGLAQRRLGSHRTQRSNNEVRVFYQVSARPLFTLGGRHVINEVFSLCGATNAFGGLDVEAASIGTEAVIDANPDLILVGLDPAGDPAASLDERAKRRLNPALRTAMCRPARGIEAAALVRPTPRILDAADRLCSVIASVRSAEQPPCDGSAD